MAGVTIGVKDLKIPDKKAGLLDTAQTDVDIEEQYREGIITRTEKYNKVMWTSGPRPPTTSPRR